MSTPRSTRHTAAVVSTLAVAVVLGAGGPAAADPPAPNVDPCVQQLVKAAEWPSSSSDAQRYFSDGYDGYLSGQPVCELGL